MSWRPICPEGTFLRVLSRAAVATLPSVAWPVSGWAAHLWPEPPVPALFKARSPGG